MTAVAFSLVSHTNVGKTTLARTLLGRDIGEVRDEPHVTELAERHRLLESPEGDELVLWDTPGFGDSVRLLARLRGRANPLGWFLAEVWDRWRDRAFWASQRAIAHVRDEADLVLYLVNAGEPEARWLASELEILGWIGKPVLVLLNQLGAPRAAADEAAEVDEWRERLRHAAGGAVVHDVLPLDAFARAWVHEATLLEAAERALVARGEGEAAAAMRRLAADWRARQEARFEQAMRVLALDLAEAALAREDVEEGDDFAARLRRLGGRLAGSDAPSPEGEAERRLAAAIEQRVRAGTAELLALHELKAGTGEASGAAVDEILSRVATQFEAHRRVPEGRSALLGGAISGALAGLKADIVTGGFTLGGGMLAGGILGALGAAGLARGLNRVRGTDRSWIALGEPALEAAADAALLRYLAVAHFGRGRGGYVQGEAPAHWPAAVIEALVPEREAVKRLCESRAASRRADAAARDRLADDLAPLLGRAARRALSALYPGRPG